MPLHVSRPGFFAPAAAAWCSALALAVSLTAVSARGADMVAIDGPQLYREAIEPVLKVECYRCHSAAADPLKAGLRLDTRAGLLQGGDTGPAVVPGKPGESVLLQALRHEDGLAMPPKKPKLAERTIAAFARWIEMGAPIPNSTEPASAVGAIDEQARRHWSFQRITQPALPAVKDGTWARTPVDAFILAGLEARAWRPAPEATRTEWIRRVTFDLTGLPPSPDEIEAFEADPSPSAHEAVVDRLLASPHYGERWGQHWLDVVRFAETEGYEYDRTIPDAWRYRDYVIRAFNADKPFDRFVTEQLAGDELPGDDPDSRIATTFHRLGPVRRNAGNPDIALSRNEVLTERTDIIGTAFLGLTIGCARCHNHKLEPIPQKDYYRLQAFLAATEEHNIVLASARQQSEWEAKSQVVKDQLQRVKERAKRAKGAEKDRLTAELEELEDRMPPSLPTIPSIHNDFAHRTAIHVLKRGVWENKGEPVGPRPLSVLMPDDAPELAADVPDPRTRLARWLTSGEHPLTARVIVNRLWQHHFGAGLVKTVNDFGLKGDRPSHRELLDWLASRLVENRWHLKPIHRLLVLSSAYRQSSRSHYAAEYAQSDPENRLFWRFNRRRLEAEEIRDAMLVAAGRMNAKAGGPSVVVPVDPELVRLLYKPSQWNIAADRSEHDRRTVYLLAKRNLRPPFLETFDAPPLLTSCARRESSTHAPQALELLNGRLSNDLAAAFAARLQRESGGKPDRFVELAFRLALGRAPTAEEHALAVEFLRDQSHQELALAVFNLNGFLYVP